MVSDNDGGRRRTLSPSKSMVSKPVSRQSNSSGERTRGVERSQSQSGTSSSLLASTERLKSRGKKPDLSDIINDDTKGRGGSGGQGNDDSRSTFSGTSKSRRSRGGQTTLRRKVSSDQRRSSQEGTDKSIESTSTAPTSKTEESRPSRGRTIASSNVRTHSRSRSKSASSKKRRPRKAPSNSNMKDEVDKDDDRSVRSRRKGASANIAIPGHISNNNNGADGKQRRRRNRDSQSVASEGSETSKGKPSTKTTGKVEGELADFLMGGTPEPPKGLLKKKSSGSVSSMPNQTDAPRRVKSKSHQKCSSKSDDETDTTSKLRKSKASRPSRPYKSDDDNDDDEDDDIDNSTKPGLERSLHKREILFDPMRRKRTSHSSMSDFFDSDLEKDDDDDDDDDNHSIDLAEGLEEKVSMQNRLGMSMPSISMAIGGSMRNILQQHQKKGRATRTLDIEISDDDDDDDNNNADNQNNRKSNNSKVKKRNGGNDRIDLDHLSPTEPKKRSSRKNKKGDNHANNNNINDDDDDDSDKEDEDEDDTEQDIFSFYTWSAFRQPRRKVQEERQVLRESVRQGPLLDAYVALLGINHT